MILADFTRRTSPEPRPSGVQLEATKICLTAFVMVSAVQLPVQRPNPLSGGLATWPWDILDQSNQDPIEGLGPAC